MVILILLKQLAEDQTFILGGGRTFQPKNLDKGWQHCVKNARDGMRRASKEMTIVGVIRMRSA
jgi:hypothetical protein